MRHQVILLLISISLLNILCASSCKRPGVYIADFKNIKGYVIGKETCNTDDSKDYWLIDFTYGSRNPIVGDTLLLNGNTYTNVLKTKGLDQSLKVIGMSVSFDYRIISAGKVLTTGCNVPSPVTYNLKELTILNQFEIR